MIESTIKKINLIFPVHKWGAKRTLWGKSIIFKNLKVDSFLKILPIFTILLKPFLECIIEIISCHTSSFVLFYVFRRCDTTDIFNWFSS